MEKIKPILDKLANHGSNDTILQTITVYFHKLVNKCPWNFCTPYDLVMTMMDDLGLDKTSQCQIIKKLISVSLRCIYYISCRRNKPWMNAELIEF